VRRVFTISAALALASCASTDPHLQTVRALERNVDELRAQIARQHERVETLSTEVQILRESTRAERPPPSLEVVRLGPPPEAEPEVAPEPEEEPVVLELTGDEDRLSVVKMPPPPSVPASVRGEVPDLAPVDPAAEADLRAALARYREGDSDDAYRRLTDVVRRAPTSTTAEQARYWMGEIQFEQARYLVAIDEYTRLRSDFPKSAKSVDALLKVGLAYERLGDVRRAKAAFTELLQQHPNSAVAELARKKVKP
jgi:tol-pal system protein YbgF